MTGREDMGHPIDGDPATGEKVNDESDPKEEDGESSGNEKSGGGTNKILAKYHHAGQAEEAEEGNGLGPNSLGKEVDTDGAPWQGTDQIQKKIGLQIVQACGFTVQGALDGLDRTLEANGDID